LNLLRDALGIREKNIPDAWLTFDTRSLLGASLLGQKKYAEAEPLLIQGYEGMRVRAAKISAPSMKPLTEGGARVVELSAAWGKKHKAAEWRQKLEPKPSDH
jgi:hypothetical protein